MDAYVLMSNWYFYLACSLSNFSCCCHKLPDKGNLEEAGFNLVIYQFGYIRD